MPRIDDTLDTLTGSKIFSTQYLRSAIWHTELSKGATENSTTIERLMKNMLKACQPCGITRDHKCGWEFIRRFRGANLRLTPKKCCFFKKTFVTLDTSIPTKGIAVDDAEIEIRRTRTSCKFWYLFYHL